MADANLPATGAATDPVTMLIETQLGMMLPPECVVGVGQNLAALAGHWANLRRFAEPSANGA